MTASLLSDAYAVLLPAIDGIPIEEAFGDFIAAGGKAILLGESRSEYLARHMSAERLKAETAAHFMAPLARLRARHGPFLVAVDQELGGICRLEGLVPALPTVAQAAAMSDDAIAGRVCATAKAARALGITMFLGPLVDVVTGSNPWLLGRTLGPDADEVGRIAAACVRGCNAAGILSVAKHFPGFSDLGGDPALERVSLGLSEDEIWRNAAPFRRVIDAGVPAIMTGPAPVDAWDPLWAASASPAVMLMLRERFGFDGLIITDDLDAAATLRGHKLADIAIQALNAGADLLLIAHGPHVPDLCRSIADATQAGVLPRERLADAAAQVRHYAARGANETDIDHARSSGRF